MNCGVKSWKQQRSCRGTLHDDDDDERDDCVVCCVSELNSKLQDTLEMIDESMDVALSKTCGSFDEAYYSRIQTAYRLLGKTQASLLNAGFTRLLESPGFLS